MRFLNCPEIGRTAFVRPFDSFLSCSSPLLQRVARCRSPILRKDHLPRYPRTCQISPGSESAGPTLYRGRHIGYFSSPFRSENDHVAKISPINFLHYSGFCEACPISANTAWHPIRFYCTHRARVAYCSCARFAERVLERYTEIKNFYGLSSRSRTDVLEKIYFRTGSRYLGGAIPARPSSHATGLASCRTANAERPAGDGIANMMARPGLRRAT